MAKSVNRSPNTSPTKTNSRHFVKAGGWVKAGLRRSLRPLFKTIGMSLALLVMLTSAALTYTYLTGRDSDQAIATQSAQAPPQSAATPIVKAPVVSPKTRAFAVVEMLDTPVKADQPVNMTIHTNPHAKCSIEVGYRPKDGSESKLTVNDSGLKDQTADEFGVAEWNWKFNSGLPAGNWRATATCAIAKQSAVVFGDIVLK